MDPKIPYPFDRFSFRKCVVMCWCVGNVKGELKYKSKIKWHNTWPNPYNAEIILYKPWKKKRKIIKK